jgi:beta-glucosidase
VARRSDAALNRLVLDPLLCGTSPLQESAFGRTFSRLFVKPGDMEIIHRLDVLGVNYYSRSVAKHHPRLRYMGIQNVKPEGSEYSMMWEIYPRGIYDLLTRIWNDYCPTCEIMVTENGMPLPDTVDVDGCVHDERRIRYIKDHLAQIYRAMQNSIPVKGYFYWSFTDNFEWALGYAPRFGLVYIDYNTLQRTIKESGRWFGQVIQANGFSHENG